MAEPVCQHRGEQLGDVPCALCGSRGVRVFVYACALHGRCTARRYKPGKAAETACLTCGDFAVSNGAARPAGVWKRPEDLKADLAAIQLPTNTPQGIPDIMSLDQWRRLGRDFERRFPPANPQPSGHLWQAWRERDVRWAPDGWIMPGLFADPPQFDPRPGERLSTPAFETACFSAATAAEPVDVVIPLGTGSRCDDAELRYALRSIELHLENLGQVWIAGHRPDWLRGVRHLAVSDPSPSKDVNIIRKLLAACHAGVSERFVFWSDDQVLLRPLGWPRLGPYTWGPVAASNGQAKRWRRRLEATGAWLRAHGHTSLHCDTHAPIPMERSKLLEIGESKWTAGNPAPGSWDAGDGMTVGTWYCNQAASPQPMGQRKATVQSALPDAELRRSIAGRWFLGFNDAGFTPELRGLLEDVFPERCRWEASGGRKPADDPVPRITSGQRAVRTWRPPAGVGVDPLIREKIEAARASVGGMPEGMAGRGIVTCAGGDLYQANAYVLFRLLRHLGCTLPIECWYDGETEEDAAWSELVEPLGVRCRDVRSVGFRRLPDWVGVRWRGHRKYTSRQLNGYGIKPFAIARSSFAEVLFLDADNDPARDPTFLFECESYREYGLFVWPDKGNSPVPEGFGQNPTRVRCTTESGQLLLDKRRNWDVAALAEWFAACRDYFFQHSWGEKEFHHFAAMCCGKQFGLAPPVKLNSHTSMIQHAPHGEPLLYHRTTMDSKWTVRGKPPCVNGFPWHTECVDWLSQWRLWRARKGRAARRISLVMVVCNEEKRLPAMLADTAPHVDEIVIVVQQSQDRTFEIARQYGDIVIEHSCHGHAGPSLPAAYAHATGDWVLFLDPDERLSEWGKQNLRVWVSAPIDFYWLRELSTAGERFMEDMPHGRLFRRGKGIVAKTVHTDQRPVDGARTATIADRVVIEHFKTGAEQDLDDQRYARLSAGKA